MLVIIIASIIIFAICLKKFNFDFKGIELVGFWILFTIFTYVKFDYYGFIFPLILLAVYYFLRLYKTGKYIKWYLFVIQIILSAVFLFIFMQYENAVCQGWCTGSLIIYVAFLGIIAYMIAINLLNFIMNKTNPIIVKIIIKIIFAIICLGIGLFLLVQAICSFQGSDPWGLSFTFYTLPIGIVGVLFFVGAIILIKSIVKRK